MFLKILNKAKRTLSNINIVNAIMLSRISERAGDFYSSPFLTQSSQNDVTNSQVDCKVPATPKCDFHTKYCDQNVPSTPFTKMKTPVLLLPDVTTVLVRETEVSHLTTSLLFNTQNVISYLQTADQLVPTTPESCRRKKNADGIDISPSPTQDEIFQEKKEETKSKSSDKKLSSSKSKLSLNKCKGALKKKSHTGTVLMGESESNCHAVNESPQQFDENSQREDALRLQTASPFSDPSLTTPSNSSSLLSSRAEMAHIRRCLFHLQTSPTPGSHDSTTEDVFSGEDIFLV
ncbi:hypothetical protein Btru_038622 [Bulinus truncatus]|nr:hypothetical protein Btru_038622 [Bulinus truncatus]